MPEALVPGDVEMVDSGRIGCKVQPTNLLRDRVFGTCTSLDGQHADYLLMKINQLGWQKPLHLIGYCICILL